MGKLFEKSLNKFDDANERLCAASNNLQYIKALNSMRFWAERMDQSCTKGDPYEEAVIMQLFYLGCIPRYSQILNSIEAYRYGDRPF